MVSALFDTNNLIDYLNIIEQAKTELEKYSDNAISVITLMEVMVGATPETEVIIRAFLHTFDTLPIETQVSEVAVKLRKKHNIKLPDAIVWATAQANKRILVIRNTKDFHRMSRGLGFVSSLTEKRNVKFFNVKTSVRYS